MQGALREPCPRAGAKTSWRRIIGEAARDLGDRGEARWIVERVSGLQPAQLLSELDNAVPPAVPSRVRALVERRLSGEPLQWVLGHWSFRGIEVAVDGRALVPRPETEIVVGHCLKRLASMCPPLQVVDLGTGSGVIALSIASECPGAKVLATDRSQAALSLARQNLARQGPEVRRQVSFAEGDWFGGLPTEMAGSVSAVVSNPPYLAAAEWQMLEAVVRDHDPYEALVAGDSGLEAVFLLIDEAPSWLRGGGALVVEIAPHQRHAALRAATAHGSYESAEVLDDLAGRPRVLVALTVT